MSAPTRVVADSMLGLRMPDAAVWSPRVTMVLGQNPGLFSGPGTNTYLVGTGKRPFLLDAGQGADAYFPILADTCRNLRPTEGFDAIVLTHGHVDHIGGVHRLLKDYGRITVFKMPAPDHDPADVAVTAIGDGDVLRTEGATLRAVWTPGHARDHLCFYLTEERALFTGDVVLGAGTTVIPDDGDLADYLASLRRLLELDAAVIYPAHGPAIHDVRARITQYIEHRELRERQIIANLAGGARRVDDIVRHIYTDVPEFLHFAAAMSVRAHLRKLKREGIAAPDGEAWKLL